MLAFVVPLMSRTMSKDWMQTTHYLEQTLKSICNQTSEKFVALVVCHEKPIVSFTHPNVRYVEVDFKLKLSDKDRIEGCGSVMEIKRTDKGRKILKGYKEAQQYKPTHVMFSDADDLVSRRLAGLCEIHPKGKGWAIERGYRYNTGSRWIYRKRKQFHVECGTGFIIRNDLIPAPELPEYDRGFDYYRFFINHMYIKEKMLRAGNPLETLPFPGAIYVIHDANLYASDRFANRDYKEYLLMPLKNFLNLRPVTSSIRTEFGMT